MDWTDVTGFYWQWPWALWLLVLVPFYPVVARWYQANRWKQLVAFSYGSALSVAAKASRGLMPLLSLAFTMLTLLMMIVTLARPTVTVRVPVRSVDMMLVMDISYSMKAKDMEPTRLEAMKQAAKRFLQSLPSGRHNDVRVGLVFFAGSPTPVHLPTADHVKIQGLLDSLQEKDLEPSTGLGNAIMTSLKLLREKPVSQDKGSPSPQGRDEKPPQKVMILMSDGDQNTGYPWDLAAASALKQNVVIHTIAIGSNRDDVTIEHEGSYYPVQLDDQSLRQIAAMTEGTFYRAYDEADFQKIYAQVKERAIDYESIPEELTVYGLLMVLLVALLMGLLPTAKAFTGGDNPSV